jgi:hypothetical protein
MYIKDVNEKCRISDDSGKKTSAPKPPTVMETFSKDLGGAHQRMAGVVRRLTEINAKLWGAVPVAVDSGNDVSPAGLASALQTDLNTLHVQLDMVETALDRLEQLV